MISSFTIRNAREDDASDMVRLVNIAEHGLTLWYWSRLAGEGQGPWAVGRQCVCEEQDPLFWGNAVIASLGTDVAAVMIGYPLDDAHDPRREAEKPVVFQPFQALKTVAMGTYYVDVLAAYAEYRGRGLGSLLLERAERQAGGLDLSLVTSDANIAALRLYRRLGFEEIDRRALISEPDWQSEGENWLLMVKKTTR